MILQYVIYILLGYFTAVTFIPEKKLLGWPNPVKMTISATYLLSAIALIAIALYVVFMSGVYK